jgi:hypothetical protein
MLKPQLDIYVSIVLIFFSIVLYFGLIPAYVPEKSFSGISPRFFPIFGTLLIGGFALFLLCISIIRWKKEHVKPISVGNKRETKKLQPIMVVVCLSIFIIVFNQFGFLIAAPITIGLLMIVFGQKHPIGFLIAAFGITGVLYVVFNYGLNLSL